VCQVGEGAGMSRGCATTVRQPMGFTTPLPTSLSLRGKCRTQQPIRLATEFSTRGKVNGKEHDSGLQYNHSHQGEMR